MAAAEVPTEAGASEREIGPFERLCRSGLRVSRPAGVPKEHEELWKKMVLDKASPFLPMDHLIEAFTILASMTDSLHASAPTPRTFLFTGQKGLGKSHLFRKFAKHVGEVDKKAAGGRLTICCCIDLQNHSSSEYENFHEWLFHEIADKLDELKRHQEVEEVLRNLATHAAGSTNDNVRRKHLPAILNLRDSSKDLSPEVREVISSAREFGRLAIASALLKFFNIAVIVIVDEAEHLYQERKFDFATTKRWQDQMEGVLRLVEPSIGMVVCASFQRARQLFLSDGSPHDFPPEYTHVSLRGNWNKTKFKSRRLGGATWTETSLKAFLLTHTCRQVDPSFTLYRGKTKKQQPGAAVDAAQEASSAVAKEERQPSEAALEMARKLDAMFLQRCKGEDEMSDAEKLKSSLEQALELYGHTPRNLADAASFHLRYWTPPSPWPVPKGPEVIEDLYQASEDHEQVMRSFLALLPTAKRAELPRATALGFRSTRYAVPRGKLTRKLKEPSEQPPAAAAGDGIAQGAATTTPAATRLIDSAIDEGWLVEHGRVLGLASLGVYRMYSRGKVHFQVMRWMRYNGYGQEAELPITRALARMPDQDGDVLVKVSCALARMPDQDGDDLAEDEDGEEESSEGGEEESSEGEADPPKQGVKASNSDTEGGKLAGVRMTVVTGRTADPPAQAAAPAESAGPPHAAAGAGGADGGGQAAGAEADWSARARAAYEALEQADDSFKEYLALRKGSFWMKELPDAYGGDVIRVSYEVKDGVTTVRIMRVQVKRANQRTLEKGDESKAGAAAVEGLMGVEPYGTAKREDIERKHKPAVRAVGDLIAAAKAMYGRGRLSPHQMPAWDRLFEAYVGGGKFHVEDGGAMIALTHTIPDGMREHVEGQLGIRIVDGTNLRGHWDILQKACDEEGVYLENAGAKPEEAAGSSRPCTSQDKLDAMFEEFMG